MYVLSLIIRKPSMATWLRLARASTQSQWVRQPAARARVDLWALAAFPAASGQGLAAGLSNQTGVGASAVGAYREDADTDFDHGSCGADSGRRAEQDQASVRGRLGQYVSVYRSRGPSTQQQSSKAPTAREALALASAWETTGCSSKEGSRATASRAAPGAKATHGGRDTNFCHSSRWQCAA